MAQVTLLHGAERDYFRIHADAEEYQAGRGEWFSAGLERALHRLESFPHLGTVIEFPYHRMKLGRVPFSAIYSVEGNRVFVHAIAFDYEPWESVRRRLGP